MKKLCVSAGIVVKITSIKMSTNKWKPKPAEGDVKVVKGFRFVRRQYRSEGLYVVCNGKPVFEWVKPYVSNCCKGDAFLRSSKYIDHNPSYTAYFCALCKKDCNVTSQGCSI